MDLRESNTRHNGYERYLFGMTTLSAEKEAGEQDCEDRGRRTHDLMELNADEPLYVQGTGGGVPEL